MKELAMINKKKDNSNGIKCRVEKRKNGIL